MSGSRYYSVEMSVDPFLLRMHKCSLGCPPVSVRPSITFVHSIHMAEDIVKLLSLHGSPIILVFF